MARFIYFYDANDFEIALLHMPHEAFNIIVGDKMIPPFGFSDTDANAQRVSDCHGTYTGLKAQFIASCLLPYDLISTPIYTRVSTVVFVHAP